MTLRPLLRLGALPLLLACSGDGGGDDEGTGLEDSFGEVDGSWVYGDETLSFVGGVAYGADLRDEHAMEALIDQIESAQGPIDLFCSNAGIGLGRGIDTSTEDWRTIIDINLMAHVFAARTFQKATPTPGEGLGTENVCVQKMAKIHVNRTYMFMKARTISPPP